MRTDLETAQRAAIDRGEKLIKANEELLELREALRPFLIFAGVTRRMLALNPDHQITQGSPMAAPQIHARDFLKLLSTVERHNAERTKPPASDQSPGR